MAKYVAHGFYDLVRIGPVCKRNDQIIFVVTQLLSTLLTDTHKQWPRQPTPMECATACISSVHMIYFGFCVVVVVVKSVPLGKSKKQSERDRAQAYATHNFYQSNKA